MRSLDPNDERPIYDDGIGVHPKPPTRMEHHDKSRIRTAAHRVRVIYPGPVGETLARELIAWEEFGFLLGGDSLIMQLVDHILKASPHRVA